MASSGWQGQKNFPYNHTDIACDINITGITHSGNTLYVTGQVGAVYRGASGGYAYYYYPVYVNVENSGTQTLLAAYERVSGTKTVDFSCSFECASDRTSAEIWVYVDMNNGTATGTLAWTLYFDSSYQQPGQPTVTIKEIYDNGAKFGVSGNYGIPSSASGRYIEAAILNQSTYGSTYRFNTASNTSSADITVTNTNYAGGSLNILGNKQYWYGGYINNTQGSNSKVTGQFVTKPGAPTVSRQTLGADSAEFAWSVAADGGYRDKTISYSVNNGSFITIGTYSGSSARSGSETLTNLIPNSQNTFSVKNATVEGNEITELTFTTLPPTPTISANAESLTSVRINYQVPADGGALTKTIAYSLDGGTTWSQGATISSGDATSGSFTIDNLSPNQSYTVTIKIMTNAGAVTLEAITVSTMSDHFVMYGPVEGEAFSGVTGVIETGGIGNITAFDGATFTAKWLERGRTLAELEQHDGTLSSEIHVLKTTESENFSVRLRYGFYYVAYDVEPADLPSWGFTYVSTNDGDDVVTLTHQYSPSGTYTTAKVAKFYGPVNGVTTQASRVYAPVKDATLDPYIRKGGAGNIISVDVDKLLFHIPPSRKQKDIAYIKFTAYPAMNGYTLEVYHTDSTSQYLLTAAALLPREIYNILGVQMKAPTVNIAVDYIDFPTGYKNRFKTKIVHQAFGHLDYSPSDYGRVTYYSGFTLGGDFKGDYSTGLTINSINHSQFYQFITQRNWLLSNGRTNMWFWMDGSNMMVNAKRADGNWENNIPAQQVFQQGGISVTLTSQSGNLILEYGTESIDTTSAQVTVDLLNNAEYQGLGNSYGSQETVNYTIGGNTVPRNAVTGFEFGTANTSTPDYFLAYAPRMVSLSIPEGTCPTAIGNSFLGYCTAFNQHLTLPDTTTVGNSFLSGCTSFNKRVSIPMVTSIGNYFLSGCKVFNQDLPLPTGLTSIGTYFLFLCSAFNQDLVLPQTLTSIGVAFMYQCNAYTQLIHLGSLSADVIASSTTSFATLSSTAPCYATGIGLIDNTEGTTVAAWMTKFPNRTGTYRKLVDMTSGTGGGN